MTANKLKRVITSYMKPKLTKYSPEFIYFKVQSSFCCVILMCGNHNASGIMNVLSPINDVREKMVVLLATMVVKWSYLL